MSKELYPFPCFIEEEDTNSYSFRQWFRKVYRFIQNRTKVTSISTAYTIKDDDFHIRVDTSGGSVVPTLPSAAQNIGRTLSFIKTSASNTMTITAQAGETINASNTLAITANNGVALLLAATATRWDILNQ